MGKIELQGVNAANLPFQSYAQASGIYTSAGGDSQQKIESTGDLVLTDGMKVDLDISADKEIAAPGEQIHYTVTIKNNSSLDLYEVKILKLPSEKSTLVESSCNPQPQEGESLETGVTIGDVPSNSTKSLEFSATVNPGSTGNIIQGGSTQYVFRDANGQEYSAEAVSELAVTSVPTAQMTVQQTADKSVVTKNGETVTYTVTVTNTGDIAIQGVNVTAYIPMGMVYVANSTVVNHAQTVDANPANGIAVGDLPQNTSAVVEYSVKVSL